MFLLENSALYFNLAHACALCLDSWRPLCFMLLPTLGDTQSTSMCLCVYIHICLFASLFSLFGLRSIWDLVHKVVPEARAIWSVKL